jgi:uncharacterized protein (TIGR03546 family)
MSRFKKIWQSFHSSLQGFDSPHQLGLGCAFGMMIGLIPNESLFVYLLALVAVVSTANLLCLIGSGIVFHFLSGAADQLWHTVGHWVLTLSSLESVWAGLYEIPLMAWTSFNNTVVAGSLIGSLVLFLPVYFVSRAFFARFGKRLYARFLNSGIARWMSENPSQTIQET